MGNIFGHDCPCAALDAHSAMAAIAPREERKACPHYQASGCILDHVEKVCEGEAIEAMDPQAAKSIGLCCCPQPYMKCSEEEANPVCLNTLKSMTQEPVTWNLNTLLTLRSTLLEKGGQTCSSNVHRD